MYKHARIRVAGAATVVALAAAAAVALPAQAAVTEVNPFASSGGFTVVSDGDASLSNGELEGSIAVTGALSTTSSNYPIRHQAAGSGDYTVPTVDGQPVRVLAGSYTGTGGIDLANGNAPTGSAEEAAIAKLVSTTGLTAGARGGGVGPASGTDFTRLTTAANGVLDVKALPWNGEALPTVKTREAAVADYVDLGGYDAAATCLAAAYGTDSVAMIDAGVQGGLAMPGPFATDRPNVLDYADIAGRTIKRDNFGTYLPTADAPLIIRVPAGTTTVSTVNIEGWSAQFGQQQGLASFIMFDLSAVTGTVTIDGVELGAIFAPHADVMFTGSRTHNGQWVTKSFTAVGGGELHHYAFLGTIACDSGDEGDADADADGADAGADGAEADADAGADGADAGADAADAGADGADAGADGADAGADAADAGADAADADADAADANADAADAGAGADAAQAGASASASAATGGAGTGGATESSDGLATTGGGFPVALFAIALLLAAAGGLLTLRAHRRA